MASNPQALRPPPAWRIKAERFWRWWSNELLAMVPERFAALAGSTRVPLVSIEGGSVALIEPRPVDGHADRIDVADMDAARASAAVRGLLQRAGESRGRARIALSPGEALVRRVTMPAATEENLSSVLGFEMDRLTPFRAEEVYYDHQVVGRDGTANTIAVMIAVARRELVEARLARARELGLSVQGVAVRENPPRPGPGLDVLPRNERGEREKPAERLAKQVLVGLALLLLLAALLVPAMRKRAQVIAIGPALERAHKEAQATDALVRELDRLAGDYNFLLARRHGNYPALAYIEELSRLLPDNTWLQQMEVKAAGKGREVLISGETVSSSKLIEILEQSRLLQNAAPRGTVTRGTQPGTERFVISAESRPRPQPEAVPVAQAAAPVAMSPAYAPAQAEPVATPAPVAATPAPAAPAQAAAPPQAAPQSVAAPQTAVVTPAGPPREVPLFQPRGKTLSPEELQRAQGK